VEDGPTSLRTAARPTMRHVAAHAGVSLKTVSRVINGEAGVAAPTALRVTEAIAALGFQRNDLARSLRQGRSSATLGLVIEDVVNPFYSGIAQAVEACARERGYMVITGSCEEDAQRERDLVHALLRRRVDALLLVPAASQLDHGWLAREAGAATPVVFLDRPPRGLDADTVLLDNHGGARQAVEHLLGYGHRRIAFVSDSPDMVTSAERLAGYRDALAAVGVAADPELERLGSHDAAQAEAVVRELLALPPGRRPTALFTGNNRHTVGAVRALRGLEQEIALVGFDDFELADLLAVPTTVVRHDAAAMGREAARLAFARLDGDAGPTRRLVVETVLVHRGSGEVAPAP
jgi:LacI family transcriptional regulator, galactose operon repressor